MNKKNIIILVLFIGLVLSYILYKNSAVAPQQVPNTTSNELITNNEVENTSKLTVKKEKVMQATLHTNKGDIVIKFDTVNTPKTAENFIKLAESGFYNGVKFHRVIKGFMIQGGDPLTKDDTKMDFWGTGGPGYQFADEITSTNKNNKGTISMANSGPNTNGSQFFINTNNNNFLDPKHTVFGSVVGGMDIVEAIENSKTNASDRPIEPIIINSVDLK